MCNEDPPKPPADYSDFFDAYSEYAKTLRTWLVGYGVGGPVIFITKKEVWEKVAASAQGGTIAVSFLIGVAFQIFIALVNKWTNWYVYATPPNKRTTKRFAFAEWVSDQFWIDMLCDIGSVAMFAWATVKTMRVFI